MPEADTYRRWAANARDHAVQVHPAFRENWKRIASLWESLADDLERAATAPRPLVRPSPWPGIAAAQRLRQVNLSC